MISIASVIIIWCFSSTEYSISCSVCPSVFRQVDPSNYLSNLSSIHKKCLSPYPHTYLLTCRLSDVTSVYLPTHLFLGLFKLFHTIISSNSLHVFFQCLTIRLFHIHFVIPHVTTIRLIVPINRLSCAS